MPIRYWTIDPTDTTAEWYTPPYIFDALGCRFDLDPASPLDSRAHLNPLVATTIDAKVSA
jgi:hypothetical protein